MMTQKPPTVEAEIVDPKPEKRPAHAWCCTATFDRIIKQIQLTQVCGDTPETAAFHVADNGKTLDTTTSPDWMEWIEHTENREDNVGGAGAYDTMRCDIIVKEPQQESITTCKKRSLIWGEDYHLKRLQNSFLSLLDDTSNSNPSEVQKSIQIAARESDMILKALIEAAKSSKFLDSQCLVARGENGDQDHTWFQLVKLTLLWSLQDPNNQGPTNPFPAIFVRGHACSSARPAPVFRSVQPIVVTVAVLGHQPKQGDSQPSRRSNRKSSQNDEARIDSSLPTRIQNPQSKVASWCKQRKKMDSPETYKPVGVSEVLMVRAMKPSVKSLDPGHTPFHALELLEGLSSNVFVVYKNGTLRTAQQGVLFGYVRHLVLESAADCDLVIDKRPITLQDCIDGKWSEVFITSSSRLIWPISRIMLPSADEAECSHLHDKHVGKQATDECSIEGFYEFWSQPTGFAHTPKWQELLESILHNSGYKR